MSLMKVRRKLLPLLGIIVAVLSAPGSATSSANESALAREVAALDASSPDVKDASLSWGVSIEEAARQLAVQETMDLIDYAALDPGFTKISSAPGPKFVIQYFGVEPENWKLVEQAIRSTGIATPIEFVQTPRTLEELTTDQGLDDKFQGVSVVVGGQ